MARIGRVILWVGLLVGPGLTVSAWADPLLCSYCRRPITGSYMVYDGRNLHESCYLSHYAQYCGLCKAEITGQYLFNSWGDTVCAPAT